MCYYVDNKLSKKQLKETFSAEPTDEIRDTSTFLNGFAHPQMPIIVDEYSTEIVLGSWGLIPIWSKDRQIQKMTLNAKIETIAEKPSFKNSVHKRCLIPVNAFYEWKWLDPKGKEKQKFYIQLENGGAPFALGGIYSNWTDKTTGELITTFSIVTTDANELMTEIHNTKRRMPLILTEPMRKDWLDDREIQDFAFPLFNPSLIATEI